MSKPLAPLGRGAVALLLAGLVACQGGDASRESVSSAAPATMKLQDLPVSPPLPGDNDPAPASPAPLPQNATLSDRLAREASSRPAGAVRSEELVSAIKARGVTVVRTRQVLGQAVNARYCAIAVTGSGLVASVCEYDSPPDALAGLKGSEERFGKVMPNRRFATNGKSLLTIANLQQSVEAEANAIAAAFAALTTV